MRYEAEEARPIDSHDLLTKDRFAANMSPEGGVPSVTMDAPINVPSSVRSVPVLNVDPASAVPDRGNPTGHLLRTFMTTLDDDCYRWLGPTDFPKKWTKSG